MVSARGKDDRRVPLRTCNRTSDPLSSSSMLEGIQKALLAGVGATVVTLDIVETGLKYLVNRGRITADEAREAARKIMEEGRKEADASGTELGTRIARALNRANLTTQDQYRALEERVRALEERVYAPETPPSPGVSQSPE